MPTYDYRCEKCNKIFSIKMSMAQHDIEGVVCPACKEGSVSQQYTTFFANTSKKS